MGFVFYDLETSGLHRDFDQIFQFAAVRTDDDLRPIEEIDLRCRRLPHVVPSPGALMILHGAPEDLDRAERSHAAMMAEIARRLAAWSPTIVLGYNSLDFDERFLRQAFYQTLHPVYATQLDGNRRADVMRMVQASVVLAPGAIVVPFDGDRPTFRLGDIARANGVALTESDAHDALADVKATVAVARLLRERAPEAWARMLANADRATVDRMLAEQAVLLHSQSVFGRAAARRVCLAGRNPDDRNEAVLFDLSVDPAPLLDAPLEALAAQFEATPRALRTVRINAQPMLVPAPPLDDLVESAEERSRAARLREHPGFAGRVGAAIRLRRARDPDAIPSPYVETRIHDGFPDREDERRRARFHRLDWPERVDLARSFGDERLRELGLRQVYLAKPGLLSIAEQTACARWQRERLAAAGEVPWLTVAKARAELDQIEAKADEASRPRLAAIRRYIEGLDPGGMASAEQAADHQDRAPDHHRPFDQGGVDAGGEAVQQPARDEGAGRDR